MYKLGNSKSCFCYSFEVYDPVARFVNFDVMEDFLSWQKAPIHSFNYRDYTIQCYMHVVLFYNVVCRCILYADLCIICNPVYHMML